MAPTSVLINVSDLPPDGIRQAVLGKEIMASHVASHDLGRFDGRMRKTFDNRLPKPPQPDTARALPITG